MQRPSQLSINLALRVEGHGPLTGGSRALPPHGSVRQQASNSSDRKLPHLITRSQLCSLTQKATCAIINTISIVDATRKKSNDYVHGGRSSATVARGGVLVGHSGHKWRLTNNAVAILRAEYAARHHVFDASV
jgi:hypothetical protein